MSRRSKIIFEPSDILKLSDISLSIGPFASSLEELARKGWIAVFRQNIFTFTCTMNFIPSEKNERILYSLKWNADYYYSENNKDAIWLEFLLIANNCDKSIVNTPRVIYAARTENPIEEFVRTYSHIDILKAMNNVALNRLKGWRPEPPKIKPNQNSWLKEQMLED